MIKKIIFSIFLSAFVWTTYASTPNFRSSVFQLVAYTYDQQADIFIPEQYGSSISLSGGFLITNAHVVLWEDQEPLKNFEVCGVVDKKGFPKCFASATLVYYDPDIDLAMLKINTSYNAPHAIFAPFDALLSSVLSVKWFPGYGLGTVTTTRGVVAWEFGEYQKIDADLDEGNSGWGAFDDKWRLIGMPTFVVEWDDTLWYIIPITKLQKFIAKRWIIMYPKNTVEKSFSSFLHKRHEQLSANIINDTHFTLSIPKDFYLNHITQTNDGDISRYDLISNNQKIAVKILAYQKLWDTTSQFEKTKDNILQEVQEYFTDVSYTQSNYKNHIYEQLFVKWSESDAFLAYMSSTIFVDSNYSIDISVNWKTFDPNFTKWANIVKNIIIKDNIVNTGNNININHINIYDIVFHLTPHILFTKSLSKYWIWYTFSILYNTNLSTLETEIISDKKMKQINLDTYVFDRNPLTSLKSDTSSWNIDWSLKAVVKNKKNTIIILSETKSFLDADETNISLTIPTYYDKKRYLVSSTFVVNTDNIAEMNDIYTFIDSIEVVSKQPDNFSTPWESMQKFYKNTTGIVTTSNN
jgi:hypothetical protein